jgi:hypothetical protein
MTTVRRWLARKLDPDKGAFSERVPPGSFKRALRSQSNPPEPSEQQPVEIDPERRVGIDGGQPVDKRAEIMSRAFNSPKRSDG